ncbi:glycosyltransferase family 9 protein [Acerihabitans sp. TG2]|uniref:glycosyltransferase family 9 protein n=1 Tax=Acerihabitans sp. TG2 TaxID=3096008 RepID=UPI002B2303EA|nr:glycosyltransferase family 9 protein [Acerihabitans sp. TG2]MEA9392334.1 glycosyltransferase family 9 protein [Acerihabitans sp. TG2]
MKKKKTYLIHIFLTIYNKFFGQFKDTKTLSAASEFNSIVIMSTTALGDLLFNTPAIDALRKRYPSAHITLVSSYKNRVLVEGSHYFDEIIYWDNKIRNAYGVIKKLRQYKPQLTVILHSHMPYDVLIAVMAGSHYVVRDSYATDSRVMNSWLAAYSGKFNGHIIVRKLALLKILGCDTDDVRMRIPVDFERQGKHPRQINIGFQMGASETIRQWPVYRFAELARAILTLDSAEKQYCIILIGSGKETPLVEAFMALLTADEKQHVISLAGKTNLKQLLSAIAGLDILVTGDTGPLHIAVALEVKTVSLFATANPHHTGPLQSPELHKIIYTRERLDTGGTAPQDFPLAIITADEVFTEIKKLS